MSIEKDNRTAFAKLVFTKYWPLSRSKACIFDCQSVTNAHTIPLIIIDSLFTAPNLLLPKTKEYVSHVWRPVFCKLALAPSTRRQLLSPKRPSKRGNGDRIGQGKPSLKYPYHHIENLRKFNRSYQSRCTFLNPSTREKAHHHARTKKKTIDDHRGLV